MKKFMAMALGLTLAVSMLTACGGGTKETKAETKAETTAETTGETTEAAAADGESLKVALCVTGAVNDMGWCQSAYEGLELLEEKYGAEIAYTENLQAADMAATFTDYAASGYDIVIGHGFQFGDPALEVGAQYPDTKFICVEADATAENVASYVMKCEEGGYIEGMLAASMTKTNKLGFIGPVEGASLIKIMNGFEDGAKSINPDIEVQTAWTGSFTDTALAQEAAQAMIDSGVDFIAHDANECGTGAINAAKAAGIYATGDSYDQHELAPETILTSSIYNVPVLIEAAYNDVVNGTFEGTVKELGMAEGVVEIAPYYDMESAIPEEVRTMIAEKIEAIKSGEFVVPCDTTAR
ncbi:MAG: BMP family ABC transporter substrate-binding protein [Clostridia bacterium]|nr:BMP family protein [Lachnospiraceae bacterium]NCB99394.1 BMP family ABC transporter substrate-binding protein [Clostridia bacterium]NCD01503.1 BMP family ABC transporter substrate-binding protein [Clostridia bacterium]